ncbi:hypothetical protein BSIN_5299 [Burkholderia singularis]|uniref:Uncharacterized protein n=1 Tax=Burkholderia singularis TaxID=1503053 RepID=A0A238HDH0_9BURK|nr:hypothetical protein BSIN_5299 [Burkholderia singularis]
MPPARTLGGGAWVWTTGIGLAAPCLFGFGFAMPAGLPPPTGGCFVDTLPRRTIA